MMKGIVQNSYLKKKNGSVSPQPIKSNPQVDESETKVKEKWNPMERNNNVDKDTEKWVEEQNAFFEKKRGKQRDEVPARFNPKGPVTILQRRHYASASMSGQVPQRLKYSKYIQSQPNNWMAGYEGTWYRKEFGAGYGPKDRKWPQGNGYGKRYGTREKKRTGKSYRPNGTQSQTYYTIQEPRKNGKYLPMKGTGNGQDGNGGDGGRDDKRKFRNSKYDFEDKKDEESDTEDSCELEITPKQLSQVVPGAGVLKIKLSKKKPIKITAEAPDGEPDPAQTKVKTVYDPTNRRDGQSISNSKPGMVVGVGQSVEKKIPLGGISQPMLRMSREERPNIPPERMGRPNGDDNGTSDRNGDSHDYGNSLNENGGPGGNRDPPDRRGGRPPRENGNPDGGDEGSDPDNSGDGDDSSSSTDSTPARRRGHRKPKYVYVLQGPPGPPGQEVQPGQPGQAGRDGRDGQALSLVTALEETLRAQRTNLDTTGIENSFSQSGRTMSEVLKAQQRTNQNLEEQFRRANETQEFQTEAMQDMAQANFQMKFDHMFAGVPIYDGTDPDTFDDWLYQIESLCEMSHRDVRIEVPNTI